MSEKWVKRTALWLLVIAVAGVIFYFSSMDGPESMEFSKGFTYMFMRLLYPNYDEMTPKEQKAVYKTFVVIVRKAAHFTEFAALGFSIWLLIQDFKVRRAGLWAWGIGTLYACTDEIHQAIKGTRTPALTDVGIDSAGVLFGTMMIIGLFYFIEKIVRRVKGSK